MQTGDARYISKHVGMFVFLSGRHRSDRSERALRKQPAVVFIRHCASFVPTKQWIAGEKGRDGHAIEFRIRRIQSRNVERLKA